MGRPADRVNGVSLVTDYGALDRAMAKKAKMEASEAKKECGNCQKCSCEGKNTPDYTEYWEQA